MPGIDADGYQQKVRPSLAVGQQRIALPFLCGAKKVTRSQGAGSCRCNQCARH